MAKSKEWSEGTKYSVANIMAMCDGGKASGEEGANDAEPRWRVECCWIPRCRLEPPDADAPVAAPPSRLESWSRELGAGSWESSWRSNQSLSVPWNVAVVEEEEVFGT